MRDDKKKQLFPFFAYIYSQQIDPEKYGKVESYEEWSKVLDENPNDMERITNAAAELSDEEWSALEQQFAQASEVQKAENGAKLDNLRKLKKGGKVQTKKKCSCGCDLIMTKGEGGKMTSRCACGCSVKKENGGSINKKKSPKFIDDESYSFKEKMNTHKIKKFKD